jgi:hypothetical protein
VKKHFTVFSTILKVKNFNITLNTLSHQQKCNKGYTITNTNINTILLHCFCYNKINFCTIIKLQKNCKDVSTYRMKIVITKTASTKIFYTFYKPDNDLLVLKYVVILQKQGYCFYNNKVVLDYSNYYIIHCKTQ